MKNIDLNLRFRNLKETCSKNHYQYGKYWEKAKKTFNVNFSDGNFDSTGSRNYLPRIYNQDIKDDPCTEDNSLFRSARFSCDSLDSIE